MSTVYCGHRNSKGLAIVTKRTATPASVITEALPLRLDLRNHSPTGFEWAYGGSGPAQLALAILADALGDERARELYQAFKWAFVAPLPHKGPWEVSAAKVMAWGEAWASGAEVNLAPDVIMPDQKRA